MNKQFIVRGDIPKEPALTIKNQLLLSPGQWKGQNITKDAIMNGLQNTDWSSQNARTIIYGHRTNDESTYFGDPSPDEIVGYHSEPKYLTLSDGVENEGMYADMFIFDPTLAAKLAYGGIKAGVSEGMEYDYYTGQIKSFINSSVVNNPACKLAFLNLSEGQEVGLGMIEPRFLNLSEKENKEEVKKETEEETNVNIDERGSNVMEDKLAKEEQTETKEEVSKEVESKEEVTVPEEPKKEEPKTEPKPEPKQEIAEEPVKAETPQPVVIEKHISKSDNSDVVEAVNKLGDKMAEEFKKAAIPQSSAPTNPNASMSGDEQVTQKLVERYKQLHPTQ